MAAAASCSRSRASLLLIFLFIFSFILSEAREYIVGGKADAWKVPSSQADSLNLWAQSSRFRISDSLVWKFDGKKDSVLQVTRTDYVNCNTSSPIASYKDGNATKVELDRSGPFYFISGAEGHCVKGEKMVVVVMSEKHARRSSFFTLAPAPSPAFSAESDGPAVALASGGTMGLHCSLILSFGVLMIMGFLF